MHGDLRSSFSMCWAERFQEAGCLGARLPCMLSGVQICPANPESCSPPHPASSNDVSVVSLTACLPSLGIIHCIPWKSCSLGCRSNPRCTKNTEDEGSTTTALLQHSRQLYCPSALSSNLLSAWSTDRAARHLQILDNKLQLHTNQLCALPPVSPGQTEGLRVDSKSLAGLGWRSTVTAHVPAACLACPIYPRHTGFPARTTCTCDALRTCQAPRVCQICSARGDSPTLRDVCTQVPLLQH